MVTTSYILHRGSIIIQNLTGQEYVQLSMPNNPSYNLTQKKLFCYILLKDEIQPDMSHKEWLHMVSSYSSRKEDSTQRVQAVNWHYIILKSTYMHNK